MTDDDHKLVISQIDFTKKDQLEAQTKAALKKILGNKTARKEEKKPENTYITREEVTLMMKNNIQLLMI